MRFIGFPGLFMVIMMSSAATHAGLLSCEQKQTLCDTECTVTHAADDAAIKSCKASCLGERAACSLASGTDSAKKWVDKAIEAGKLAGDEAKAFIEGFNKKQ